MSTSATIGDLGRYRMVRALGHGGMGEVYLARDLMLERDVAIKLLPARRGAKAAARKRLLREAQLAAALDHPDVCATYEVGEAPDGRGFIVMQDVEGETMAATLRRGARRTTARAQLQLAATRYELVGLSVMSRAQQALDHFDRARVISADILASAEALKDDEQVGIALSSLASLATALGQFPEALALRERAERMRRERNDASVLPYDLTNRAEVLIHLGRLDEASRALDELEVGVKAGIDAYVGRARRAIVLRALAAVVALRYDQAERLLSREAPSGDGSDWVTALAPVLLEYSRARLGHGAADKPSGGTVGVETMPPVLVRERQYWLAATALARGRARDAVAEAERGLLMAGDASNDERRWRLAAIGAIAAETLGDATRARELRRRATESLGRLRAGWRGDIQEYERRPDLSELRARTGWL